MTVIDKLREHEANELDFWYAKSDDDQKNFEIEIQNFARHSFQELEAYCKTVIPTEFSSLSIIYNALSEETSEWSAFLLEEYKRILSFAKQKRFAYEHLEVLEDIDLCSIYENSPEDYYRFIDQLVKNLSQTDEHELTHAILDLIDWTLLVMSEDEDYRKNKRWFYRLAEFANEGNFKNRLLARDILEDTFVYPELKPLTFIEKVREFLRL